MKKLIFAILFCFTTSAMAVDTEISDLTADAAPGTDSILVTIDDPAGTAVSRRSTVGQVLGASANMETDGTIQWEDATALGAAGDLVGDIVDEDDIADDGVDSEHYNDGSIDAVHLAADVIDETKIADDGIDSEHYNDGSVDPVHLSAVSGSDATVITGTAGTDTYVGVWNVDGDLVDGPGVPYVVGGTDVADADVADNITLTNITQITNRAWTDLTGTNWRLTATNGSGVPTEVTLGADGTFLMSNGAAVAPTFEAAPGGGTMTTVKQGVTGIGDADIIALDFSVGAFTASESPNTEVNISTRHYPCAVLDDLAAGDDNQSLGSRPVAITLVKVWCFYRGTGTTAAQISFEDAGGTAMTTSAALECVAHSATPSEGSGMETFTGGNTLIAYEGLFLDVDNTPAPTTDDYTICWEYTID